MTFLNLAEYMLGVLSLNIKIYLGSFKKFQVGETGYQVFLYNNLKRMMLMSYLDLRMLEQMWGSL